MAAAAAAAPAAAAAKDVTPLTSNSPVYTAARSDQVPEATPGEKHRAFTVNCEWGSLASWLETLLPEDELPSASSSGHGSTTSSWSALGSSSSTVRKGELGMWGARVAAGFLRN